MPDPAAAPGEPMLVVEDQAGGHDGVRLLKLNRLERRNALSPDLVSMLTGALKAADADPKVRALVLTGAGDKAFCAGGDLGGGMTGDGVLDMHYGRRGFVELLKAFRGMRTPTVAAVNGYALGGGFGLVLACDFAVASENASLGTPEVQRGLFPMMIGRLVYEILPRRAANELVLLGEKIKGQRAADLGIVNKVVPAGEVLDEALGLAERLSKLSPAVLGLGRTALNQQLDMPHDVALEHLHQALTVNLSTEDAAEGISAFFEKRDPVWRGR